MTNIGLESVASKEKGERLFDAATTELEGLIEWLADRPLTECWQRDHR